MTADLRPSIEAASALDPGSGERPHLVDVTMYWSVTGGGVARYLRDKKPGMLIAHPIDALWASYEGKS